jgi:hypothetical protein
MHIHMYVCTHAQTYILICMHEMRTNRCACTKFSAFSCYENAQTHMHAATAAACCCIAPILGCRTHTSLKVYTRAMRMHASASMFLLYMNNSETSACISREKMRVLLHKNYICHFCYVHAFVLKSLTTQALYRLC